MAIVIASCMSGGQAITLLFVFTAPFAIPLAGYPLQWACRVMDVAVPDFNRALQITFAELILGIVIATGSLAVHYYISVDLPSPGELLCLLAFAIIFAIPFGVYVPMLRINLSSAIVISVLRYLFTAMMHTVGLGLWMCAVALIGRLAH
jgi:hypothetical protein